MRNAALAALALLVAGPAMAEDLTLRDLEVVPSAPAVAPAAVSSVALDAWFDRADATYAYGDAVTVFARASEDGYLSAFSIGPTGTVTQIYPNAFHPDNFTRAGATVEIPGPGARAMVTGALGAERIQIVLTRSREAVCAPQRLAGQGPFRSVIGGAPELRRDLEVTAASEPDGRVATIERTLRTTAARIEMPRPGQVVFIDSASSNYTFVVPSSRGYSLPRY